MNKTLSFEILNNKKVFNILTEPETLNKKLVIMSHGFRGSSIGPARTFVDFENILLKEGFSVLRFDQPNSGNSDGDYIDSSYAEWVDTILYFANKYLSQGYRVALLGQSMGAAATMIAASKLGNKIPCIILWVPGVNEGDSNGASEDIFEEAGQKYKGKFWIEAKDADFFKSFDSYHGGIHTVYGEKDRFISQELRDKVINVVKSKGQPFMILKGQEHSPWEYDVTQEVYKEELDFLKKFI